MDEQGKLSILLNLARESGIIVRRVSSRELDGRSGGGLVRLRDREILMLDSSAPLAEQVAVAAEAIRGRCVLRDRFLPPEIRELVDDTEAL